jgi:hypothetical protein
VRLSDALLAGLWFIHAAIPRRPATGDRTAATPLPCWMLGPAFSFAMRAR